MKIPTWVPWFFGKSSRALVGTSWNTGPHGENPTELSLDGTLRNYLMKKAAAHEAGRCPSLETEKKVGESQFLGMSQMYVHYM